jgi:hypothetical protein
MFFDSFAVLGKRAEKGCRKRVIGGEFTGEASQTRPSVAVALSGQAPWNRAARPDPSRREERSLRMTRGAVADMIRGL